MIFNLKYGREKIDIELPDDLYVKFIHPPHKPPISDLEKSFISTLENPIDSTPLKKIVDEKQKILLIVSDKTRPCAYSKILPILVDYLNSIGVPDKNISILVAYGIHKKHRDAENSDIFGQNICNRIRILHHDSERKSELVFLEQTSFGTPIELNRNYVEADTTIVISSVTHHYFAGFGSGRKVIFPGIASKEGIQNNHKLIIGEKGGTNEYCVKGNLYRNPVNDDIIECVEKLPPSFTINCVINGNYEITNIFSGDWDRAHKKACKFLNEQLTVKYEEKFDLVIASCGGYPKDINFIQAHKTIDNAFDFVKPGGVMVILAECTEGLGSTTFLSWFNYDSRAEMEKALRENYKLHGGTALSLRLKTEKSRVYLYSKLADGDVEKIGLIPVKNVEQTIQAISKNHRERTIAVIPEGSTSVLRQPDKQKIPQ